MKGSRRALAPVGSLADRGLRPIDVVGVVLLMVIGGGLLFGGVTRDVPGLAVLGAGCLGVFLLAVCATVLHLRVLTSPAPTVSVVDGRAATVLRREPVAFRLGLVIMAVIGATPLGWAVLAARSSTGLAVILAATGLWLFVPMLLAVLGRFTPGMLALTADGLDYRSRGLSLSIAWDDIAALDSQRSSMVMVLSRGGRPIPAFRTAGWFTGEHLLSSDAAVLRTDAMAVDEHQLAPVLWRYATTPSARAELGTPSSLAQLTPPAPRR